MNKNSKIHLWIETELFEALKKQALEQGISLSDICRQKLKYNSQLDRIEMMIGKIYKLQQLKTSEK